MIPKKDQKFMAQALKLATLGGRMVTPNPMVGAIIVKNDKVIGKGYHQIFGGPHAEVNAINSVENKSDLIGATMYVTLEPCQHHGKTPPCQDLIEKVGISKVICGSRDPLHGAKQMKGGAKISKRKILDPSSLTCRQVQNDKFLNHALRTTFLTGKLEKKCKELNKFFFTWATKNRPYITVKIATSADGFVAVPNGQSVHFTSKIQDKRVHQLRAQHQAIMVGSNTVLSDNPQLNVRHVNGQDPLRIILDSKKRVPETAKIFKDENFLHITKRISLKNLFQQLAKDGIVSVLVEPGPTLYNVLKKDDLIDGLVILRGKKKIGEGLSIDL